MKTFIFAFLVLFSTQSFARDCNSFVALDKSELHFTKHSEFVIIDPSGNAKLFYIPSAGTDNSTVKIYSIPDGKLHDFGGGDKSLIIDGKTYRPNCK